MSASMFIYDLVVTLLVALVAIVAIGARSAWQAIRGAAVLDRAVGRVTRAAGMLELGARERPEAPPESGNAPDRAGTVLAATPELEIVRPWRRPARAPGLRE